VNIIKLVLVYIPHDEYYVNVTLGTVQLLPVLYCSHFMYRIIRSCASLYSCILCTGMKICTTVLKKRSREKTESSSSLYFSR